MAITRLNYESYGCNCYVIGEEGGPCLLVDCGPNYGGRLFSYIERHHSRLEGILLTHGHYDHIAGLPQAPKGVTVFLSEEELDYLSLPNLNQSYLLFGEALSLEPEEYAIYPLSDEDEIVTPSFAFKVIATPFHTPGSVCFLFERLGAIFTGDTLFHPGIGRTDLKGGNPRLIASSLGKLASLPPELSTYPGHGNKGRLGEDLLMAKAYY